MAHVTLPISWDGNTYMADLPDNLDYILVYKVGATECWFMPGKELKTVQVPTGGSAVPVWEVPLPATEIHRRFSDARLRGEVVAGVSEPLHVFGGTPWVSVGVPGDPSKLFTSPLSPLPERLMEFGPATEEGQDD